MINTNNFIVSALKPVDFSKLPSKSMSDEEIATKYNKNLNYFISGVTTIAGGVGGWEYTNKNFNIQKDEIVKNYDNYIDGLMERAIQKRIEIEGSISQAEIDELRGFKYDRYRRNHMDKPIAELKNSFKKIFVKNAIIGTFIGAALGSLLLLKTHNEIKKKQTK